MIHKFDENDLLIFDYVNTKGEKTERKVAFIKLEYGQVPHWNNGEPAWFIRAYESEKGERSYYMPSISNVRRY